MKLKITLLGLCLSVLTACSSIQPSAKTTHTLPLLTAWYNGETVYYVTTDVSDQAMAKDMGANYAPRLRDAIPNYPKPPRQKTVLERVYGFPQGVQRNVFPSAPQPIGHESQSSLYSPVWLMYLVKWVNPVEAYELTSESAIFSAEAKGLVTIERTNIVVNCPIVNAP